MTQHPCGQCGYSGVLLARSPPRPPKLTEADWISKIQLDLMTDGHLSDAARAELETRKTPVGWARPAFPADLTKADKRDHAHLATQCVESLALTDAEVYALGQPNLIRGWGDSWLQHTCKDPEVLRKALTTKDYGAIFAAVQNPNTPEDVLVKIIENHGNPLVPGDKSYADARIAIARRPNLPMHLAKKLMGRSRVIEHLVRSQGGTNLDLIVKELTARRKVSKEVGIAVADSSASAEVKDAYFRMVVEKARTSKLSLDVVGKVLQRAGWTGQRVFKKLGAT